MKGGGRKGWIKRGREGRRERGSVSLIHDSHFHRVRVQ